MNSINETVCNLDRLRIEKSRREEELIKDSNSEATTFEQLTIKVQLMSKSMQNEVANKSWVESLMDKKISELDKKFETKPCKSDRKFSSTGARGFGFGRFGFGVTTSPSVVTSSRN